MKRSEIAYQFRDQFLLTNEKVVKVLDQYYIAINGEDVIHSKLPYSADMSDYSIYMFSYKYKVIENYDVSMAALFFNKNGAIDEYIEIDGWKLKFYAPITSLHHCDRLGVIISKEELQLNICYDFVGFQFLVDKMDKIWRLFTAARGCTTQMELDLILKVFNMEDSLDSIKKENLLERAARETAEIQIDAYKVLLNKIDTLVSNNN